MEGAQPKQALRDEPAIEARHSPKADETVIIQAEQLYPKKFDQFEASEEDVRFQVAPTDYLAPKEESTKAIFEYTNHQKSGCSMISSGSKMMSLNAERLSPSHRDRKLSEVQEETPTALKNVGFLPNDSSAEAFEMNRYLGASLQQVLPSQISMLSHGGASSSYGGMIPQPKQSPPIIEPTTMGAIKQVAVSGSSKRARNFSALEGYSKTTEPFAVHQARKSHHIRKSDLTEVHFKQILANTQCYPLAGRSQQCEGGIKFSEKVPDDLDLSSKLSPAKGSPCKESPETEQVESSLSKQTHRTMLIHNQQIQSMPFLFPAVESLNPGMEHMPQMGIPRETAEFGQMMKPNLFTSEVNSASLREPMPTTHYSKAGANRRSASGGGFQVNNSIAACVRGVANFSACSLGAGHHQHTRSIPHLMSVNDQQVEEKEVEVLALQKRCAELEKKNALLLQQLEQKEQQAEEALEREQMISRQNQSVINAFNDKERATHEEMGKTLMQCDLLREQLTELESKLSSQIEERDLLIQQLSMELQAKQDSLDLFKGQMTGDSIKREDFQKDLKLQELLITQRFNDRVQNAERAAFEAVKERDLLAADYQQRRAAYEKEYEKALVKTEKRIREQFQDQVASLSSENREVKLKLEGLRAQYEKKEAVLGEQWRSKEAQLSKQVQKLKKDLSHTQSRLSNTQGAKCLLEKKWSELDKEHHRLKAQYKQSLSNNEILMRGFKEKIKSYEAKLEKLANPKKKKVILPERQVQAKVDTGLDQKQKLKHKLIAVGEASPSEIESHESIDDNATEMSEKKHGVSFNDQFEVAAFKEEQPNEPNIQAMVEQMQEEVRRVKEELDTIKKNDNKYVVPLETQELTPVVNQPLISTYPNIPTQQLTQEGGTQEQGENRSMLVTQSNSDIGPLCPVQTTGSDSGMPSKFMANKENIRKAKIYLPVQKSQPKMPLKDAHNVLLHQDDEPGTDFKLINYYPQGEGQPLLTDRPILRNRVGDEDDTLLPQVPATSRQAPSGGYAVNLNHYRSKSYEPSPEASKQPILGSSETEGLDSWSHFRQNFERVLQWKRQNNEVQRQSADDQQMQLHILESQRKQKLNLSQQLNLNVCQIKSQKFTPDLHQRQEEVGQPLWKVTAADATKSRSVQLSPFSAVIAKRRRSRSKSGKRIKDKISALFHQTHDGALERQSFVKDLPLKTDRTYEDVRNELSQIEDEEVTTENKVNDLPMTMSCFKRSRKSDKIVNINIDLDAQKSKKPKKLMNTLKLKQGGGSLVQSRENSIGGLKKGGLSKSELKLLDQMDTKMRKIGLGYHQTEKLTERKKMKELSMLKKKHERNQTLLVKQLKQLQKQSHVKI